MGALVGEGRCLGFFEFAVRPVSSPPQPCRDCQPRRFLCPFNSLSIPHPLAMWRLSCSFPLLNDTRSLAKGGSCMWQEGGTTSPLRSTCCGLGSDAMQVVSCRSTHFVSTVTIAAEPTQGGHEVITRSPITRPYIEGRQVLGDHVFAGDTRGPCGIMHVHRQSPGRRGDIHERYPHAGPVSVSRDFLRLGHFDARLKSYGFRAVVPTLTETPPTPLPLETTGIREHDHGHR